jgi:hypothetical protein
MRKCAKNSIKKGILRIPLKQRGLNLILFFPSYPFNLSFFCGGSGGVAFLLRSVAHVTLCKKDALFTFAMTSLLLPSLSVESESFIREASFDRFFPIGQVWYQLTIKNF